MDSDELSAHQTTYRGFVKGVGLFALHTLIILGLLAYFFV